MFKAKQSAGDKLSNRWVGPYKIKAKISPLIYQFCKVDGSFPKPHFLADKLHVQKMRPYVDGTSNIRIEPADPIEPVAVRQESKDNKVVTQENKESKAETNEKRNDKPTQDDMMDVEEGMDAKHTEDNEKETGDKSDSDKEMDDSVASRTRGRKERQVAKKATKPSKKPKYNKTKPIEPWRMTRWCWRRSPTWHQPRPSNRA